MMAMGVMSMGLMEAVAGGGGVQHRGMVCQEVPRLGVDAHHAQVAVSNSLAIRVFRERFPYFKYIVELRAKAHFFSKQTMQERLSSLEGF